MDIVTNESVTALARRLGNKRGWKEQMPAMPPGMPAGGVWSQDRKGNVVRLRYQVAPNSRAHVIGEWTVDDAAAPAPRVNGTGPKDGRERPAPPPPAPEPVASEEVEPLILLTPAGGGAWRLSGYGVARAELIRALRLSLVHLVARQAGALIIDEVVAPEMAVVASNGLRERIERIEPQKQPQKRPQKPQGRVKKTVSYPDDDLIDDVDEAW